MRLFIAVSLAPALIEELTAIQKAIRTEIDGIRWVKPENMHVTLKFIGEAEPGKELQIETALENIRYRVFNFRNSSEIGAFPNRKNPRVLWVGIRRETAMAMEGLFHQIENSLMEVGIESEKRKFKPHLTLGRIPSHLRWNNAWWRRIMDLSVEEHEFRVSGFELFESRLTPAGAFYRVVKRYGLLS